MWSSGARTATMILAVALLAVACGGSNGGQSNVASSDQRDPGSDAPTNQLIAAIGSPESAFDAVVLSLNLGYLPVQILAAIDTNALGADGNVVGVSPGGSAPNFLAQGQGEGSGEGASGPLSTGPIGEVQLIKAAQNWTLDAIRQTTRANAEVYGFGSDSNSMLQFIIAMMRSGFSAGEVTEMIVIGIDEVVKTNGCSGLRIGQEVLFADAPDDECTVAPGRYPADRFRESDDDPGDEPAIEAAPTAEVEEAAPDVEWAGPVQGAFEYVGQGESTAFGELENVAVEFDVSAGQVNAVVTRTTWGWQRGGPDPLDRNCGSRLVEELVGTGPLLDSRATSTGQQGRVFSLPLEVQSSNAIDRSGTLCELVDWTKVEREAGRTGGRFSGIAGPWGLEGSLGSIPLGTGGGSW